jgi:hypothetical protein
MCQPRGYNGFGDRKRGLPSPYVWAASDIYSKGRYGLGGQFNAELKVQSVGVAAVLKGPVARGVIKLCGRRCKRAHRLQCGDCARPLSLVLAAARPRCAPIPWPRPPCR